MNKLKAFKRYFLLKQMNNNTLTRKIIISNYIQSKILYKLVIFHLLPKTSRLKIQSKFSHIIKKILGYQKTTKKRPILDFYDMKDLIEWADLVNPRKKQIWERDEQIEEEEQKDTPIRHSTTPDNLITRMTFHMTYKDTVPQMWEC